MTDTNYHELSYAEVLEKLHTPISGLSSNEAHSRTKIGGQNIITNKNEHTLWSIILEQFASPLIFILIFACLITLYLGDSIESIVIFGSVLINVALGVYQEFSAENTLRSLRKLITHHATVLRDDEIHFIEAGHVCVGDIIILQAGERVPADARLIEVTSLDIDESILTGESLPVCKHANEIRRGLISERNNSIFQGTFVSGGRGRAVVTAIGNNTELGKISNSLDKTHTVITPVGDAVSKLSRYVTYITIIITLIIIAIGIYRGESLYHMLVLALAVAVGAIPESLPITLTVILSRGVFAISKKGGLVRNLGSSETLGSTSLILTDKTGTLTEGKLSLREIIPCGEIPLSPLDILTKAHNNISCSVEKPNPDKNTWIIKGNAFESIILKEIYAQTELKDTITSEMISPFNSKNKYSLSRRNNEITILGAPDILLHYSSQSISVTQEIRNKLEHLTSESNRIVAIGTTELDHQSNLMNVTIQGLFVFSDPLRPLIKQHIAHIQSFGIPVKIVSGDHPQTVASIARQVGIACEKEHIITGGELSVLSDQELLPLLKNITIFARVTPDDKLRIGKLYQSLGEIVAMTGDGVNDAQSLKAMDIGISLASGTDVAKNASDIILLTDNFNTITETIKEGMNIKSNIQKSFVYLMSNSLDEIFVTVSALIFALPIPLTALQIIWINMVTGALPAMAFAFDTNDLSNRKHSGEIFSSRIRYFTFSYGLISSVLLAIMYPLLLNIGISIILSQSIFFACFGLYILGVTYSFKNIEKTIGSYPLFNNMLLNIANIIGVLLLAITIFTRLGNSIFTLVPIPATYLWIPCAWVILNIVIVECMKYIIMIKKPHNT